MDDEHPTFIPSCKLSHNYGKSQFLMGKFTISMAVFNSKLLVYQRVNPSSKHPQIVDVPGKVNMQKTNWNDPPFYSVNQLFRLGHGFNSKLFTRGYPQIVDVYSLRVSLRMMEYLMRYQYMIEGSLEVKLPTIWTDEKQSRAEAERRGRLEERRSEEKE